MKASARQLPDILTSYDLLKTFAVLTMIADHIGAFFYPEELWLRVIGRMSAPVWLFLVGYALSRDFSPRLWIGAVVLIVASGVLGPSVLPINILVTILCVRLVLDYITDRVLTSFLSFAQISTLIFLLALPTIIVTDYGAVALSIALYGAAMRRRHEGGVLFKHAQIITGVTALIFYNVTMLMLFKFSALQDQLMIVACGVVFIVLYYFQPAHYSGFTQKAPKILTGFLQFCGRRTLEIYVVHLILFKTLAVYLGVEGVDLLEWPLG